MATPSGNAPLSTAAGAQARSRFEPMAWDEADGKLVRVVKKADFADALAYVNRVGAVAEARNHHPDIEISWNTVTLRLWSHNAGKVTDADRDLAAAIDALDGDQGTVEGEDQGEDQGGA
jgi:4a-hydroxytetrahydrobiopterin dehydratase